jgi:hypothetical protein
VFGEAEDEEPELAKARPGEDVPGGVALNRNGMLLRIWFF